MDSGFAIKEQNALVTSSYTFQVSHAVFCPLPPKLDTVLQPVNEWNIGNAMQWSGPRDLAISWAARKRRCFPVPNAIRSSETSRRWAAVTANTTTSVSTVRMESSSFSSFTASSRWRIILVSACSWVHGASFARSLGWLDNTSELYVLIITSLLLSLVMDMDVTMVARKAKSSILFSSMRRNSCQFPGIVLEACTRLRLKSTGLCLKSTGPKQCQRYLRAVNERECMAKRLVLRSPRMFG